MDTIHTFQEFMLHTKNILYILVVMILLAMPAIWKFMNPKEQEPEQTGHRKQSHHGGA